VPALPTRARMWVRRVFYDLRDMRWWAVTALLLAVVTVVLALLDIDMDTVFAVGIAAVVTAVLSIKET
jgi:hypothetical protein